MSPFSILLHEFRPRSNLRQSDPAEKFGYEQSYLSSLEVGRKGRPTRRFAEDCRGFSLARSRRRRIATGVGRLVPNDRDP
ncbi:helix-turn-helix domain-containing protein [Paraburkholderia sp. 2C]